MRDHFTRAWLSGAIAGGLAEILNLFLIWIFNASPKHFIDFAEVLIFGTRARNYLEFALAFLGYLIFCGFLGVFYSYLLKSIGTANHLFKSVVYAVTTWFFIYAIVILFKTPAISDHAFKTTIINLFTATIFGITLDISFSKLKIFSNIRST